MPGGVSVEHDRHPRPLRDVGGPRERGSDRVVGDDRPGIRAADVHREQLRLHDGVAVVVEDPQPGRAWLRRRPQHESQLRATVPGSGRAAVTRQDELILRGFHDGVGHQIEIAAHFEGRAADRDVDHQVATGQVVIGERERFGDLAVGGQRADADPQEQRGFWVRLQVARPGLPRSPGGDRRVGVPGWCRQRPIDGLVRREVTGRAKNEVSRRLLPDVRPPGAALVTRLVRRASLGVAELADAGVYTSVVVARLAAFGVIRLCARRIVGLGRGGFGRRLRGRLGFVPRSRRPQLVGLLLLLLLVLLLWLLLLLLLLLLAGRSWCWWRCCWWRCCWWRCGRWWRCRWRSGCWSGVGWWFTGLSDRH